ncbi:MAG: DUF4430 domain-containing protein [Eubacteriales bacterium]|nr:DUF4430 domain-containing protein [Eubacteriales bacterium]
MVEDVKIGVSGISRTTETKDGINYTASVGYRISSISLAPVVASDVEITVNGEVLKDKYALSTGENIFTVVGVKNGVSHTVTLKVIKESAPSSTGKIKVYFSLFGDSSHGDNGETHTLKNGGLTEWIARTSYELDAPATVLDVFEKALKDKYTFVNADGNYISKIDNLAEFSNGANSGWMYTLNGICS